MFRRKCLVNPLFVCIDTKSPIAVRCCSSLPTWYRSKAQDHLKTLPLMLQINNTFKNNLDFVWGPKSKLSGSVNWCSLLTTLLLFSYQFLITVLPSRFFWVPEGNLSMWFWPSGIITDVVGSSPAHINLKVVSFTFTKPLFKRIQKLWEVAVHKQRIKEVWVHEYCEWNWSEFFQLWSFPIF